MRRVISFVLAAALFSFAPATAVEIGTPDPTPAPKVSCGGLPCSFLDGKYFAFAGFDGESFAELPNLGQFCVPPFRGDFDYCRVPGKNSIPTNNLNKVILKNGWVELSYPVKYDLSLNPAVIFPPKFLGLKITLQGANAQFGTYPQPNFTFSADRITVYIKAHTVSFPPPSANGVILQIKAPSLGEIRVTGFLEVGENTYSTSPSEIGKILVVSKYDEFVFSTDKKTGRPIATKDIKKISTCTKGKVVKKVLQKNLISSICPTGFKVKT